MRTINDRIQKQKDKITEAKMKIIAIQNECSHIGVNVKYGADTGNWSPSDNRYWIDWTCPECEKHWVTPQDKEAHETMKALKAIKL